MDIKRFNQIFEKILDNVNTVIHGKDDVVRLSLVAICAGGHILFEDVPGVGRSMLATALGRSMQAETNRVQCTLDMLRGDSSGSSIIDARTMEVYDLEPVINSKQVLEMAELSSEVNLTTAVESYILDITHATRADASLNLGAGPRASIALGKASRVMAASDGRDKVYPED